MKIVLGVIACVVVLVVLAGVILWRMMGEPLYRPGMVRSGANLRGPLDPPPQTADGSEWLVEPDIHLHYRAVGQGHPVLIVHGGPGFPIHEPWNGLQPLTSKFQFYYYDQRGCGRSTRPFDRFESKNFYANMKQLEQTLGIGAQVADIERIRRILGQEKIILIGHSFGGLLAALYAAEFPEHVQALVLVAPAGVLVLPDEPPGFFELIRARLPEDRRTGYDQFLKEYFDLGSVFSKSEAELGQVNRQLGQFYNEASGVTLVPPLEANDNGGWMVQAAYFSLGRRHDYRPALRDVTAPVLIVHGQDDLMPQRVSQMYADCLPHARLGVVKSGGGRMSSHFVYNDQPEEFAKVVGEFLDSVTSPAGQ